MSKPLFSIITVCYNSEKTINKTIESLMNQSYEDFEYIIVDGGSTDRTVEIIKSFKDKAGNKVEYISEPDNGIYDAMNKGVKLSQGEYIVFMNSDDWFEQDSLKNVSKIIKENREIDIVFGNIKAIRKYKNKLYYKVKIPNTQLLDLRKGMIFSHQTMFTKKSVFNSINYFDVNYKIAADWDFIIRAWKKGYKFKYIDEILGNFTYGGACSKSHILEKHSVRKKNNLYRYFDFYIFLDILNVLKDMLVKVILEGNEIFLKKRYKELN